MAIDFAALFDPPPRKRQAPAAGAFSTDVQAPVVLGNAPPSARLEQGKEAQAGCSQPLETPAQVSAQAQRLLDFGKRHGWPALRITPWCTLPGGEFNWRRFVEHLVGASKVPLVEAERRRTFALAIAALEAWEKQGCSPAGTRLPATEQAQNRP